MKKKLFDWVDFEPEYSPFKNLTEIDRCKDLKRLEYWMAYVDGSKGKYRENIFLHIHDRVEKLDPIPQC